MYTPYAISLHLSIQADSHLTRGTHKHTAILAYSKEGNILLDKIFSFITERTMFAFLCFFGQETNNTRDCEDLLLAAEKQTINCKKILCIYVFPWRIMRQ